jgi:hypothetical protein
MPDLADPATDGPGSEDLKLVTLARASRARAGAAQGAAVRDETGRTYTAASVTLASLELSALRAAVVMASSSGARSLEAAAVVGGPRAGDPAPAGAPLPERDLAAVRDLGGPGTPVLLAGPDGTVHSTVWT